MHRKRRRRRRPTQRKFYLSARPNREIPHQGSVGKKRALLDNDIERTGSGGKETASYFRIGAVDGEGVPGLDESDFAFDFTGNRRNRTWTVEGLFVTSVQGLNESTPSRCEDRPVLATIPKIVEAGLRPASKTTA